MLEGYKQSLSADRLDDLVGLLRADGVTIDTGSNDIVFRPRQIGFADLVVLNKADLAGPDQVALVRRWIDGMMNSVCGCGKAAPLGTFMDSS